MAQYFREFVFSDQVGRLKANPDCFRSAATQLDLDFSEILHVRDRDAKEVASAHAVVSTCADLIRVIGDIALRYAFALVPLSKLSENKTFNCCHLMRLGMCRASDLITVFMWSR